MTSHRDSTLNLLGEQRGNCCFKSFFVLKNVGVVGGASNQRNTPQPTALHPQMSPDGDSDRRQISLSKHVTRIMTLTVKSIKYWITSRASIIVSVAYLTHEKIVLFLELLLTGHNGSINLANTIALKSRK